MADTETAAEGDALTVDGQFQAKFYACDTDDPKVHYRGVLLFGQNVDVVVKAGADA